MASNEHDELEGFEEVEEVGSPTQPPLAEGAGIPWGAVIVVIWAVALVIFSVQNADDVTVSFLAWEWRMPLAVLVMFTALATLALALVGMAYRKRRVKRLRDRPDS